MMSGSPLSSAPPGPSVPSPETGATIPVARPGEILELQKHAQLRDGPPSAAVRRERIDRLIGMLVDHSGPIAAAIDADFGGRAKTVSALADVAGSIDSLKHARRHVEGWMRPEKREVTPPLAALLGARAEIRFQPKGVVGIIAPWNFPVQLAMAPLAGVFAAGNRAMIKPSELTPRTSALLAGMIGKAFAIEELAVVTGGPELGAAFSGLAFDHLVFTGATSVARHVMRAAAENLVPLTLELGGKSPALIGRSADMGLAANRILAGKTMNAGQICLAPDYALVPSEKVSEFAAAALAACQAMYPAGSAGSSDYTAMINDRHFNRVEALIEDARDKGAVIAPLDAATPARAGNARYITPTLILGATPAMKVMQEEIFGPLLPVMSYERIEAAIDHVNSGPRPLALYYFGKDAAEEAMVLNRTVSGGVTVNDVIFHVAMEDLPFGGIGPSGMGAYHGRDGFLEFSHRRAIYRQLPKDIGPLAHLRPPFGAAIKSYLDARIRR